jgi:hypothetical protein
VDIWATSDPLLQPMQKVRAEEEKRRNYRAVVHLKDKRLVTLASADMPDLTVGETAGVALGSSDLPYRQLISWDTDHNDYYAVCLQDGTRKKLLEESRFGGTRSPGGTYLLTFNADDSQWYSGRVLRPLPVGQAAPGVDAEGGAVPRARKKGRQRVLQEARRRQESARALRPSIRCSDPTPRSAARPAKERSRATSPSAGRAW